MKKFTFFITTLYIMSAMLVHFVSIGCPINYIPVLGLINAINTLVLIFLVVPSVMITFYRSNMFKSTLLFIGCTFTTMIASSQVYVVRTDTIQKFEHPSELKFIEAVESESMNYTTLNVGEVIYTIDLEQKTLFMKNGEGNEFEFVITEIFPNPSRDVLASFECTDSKGFKGVMALYKSENGTTELLVEYDLNNGFTEGYMCFNVAVEEELFTTQ